MIAASHAPDPLLTLLPRANLRTFTFDLWCLLGTAGVVATSMVPSYIYLTSDPKIITPFNIAIYFNKHFTYNHSFNGFIKAALIIVFLIATDQLTTWYVKGGASSYQPGSAGPFRGAF